MEIFFSTTTRNTFQIEYLFHEIDFGFWLKILEIHKEHVKNPILYDCYTEKIITNIQKDSNYYHYRLESDDFNLYRNINLIFYFIDENKNWNNMEDQLKKNTWSGCGIF